jgi:hypothetical protein
VNELQIGKPNPAYTFFWLLFTGFHFLLQNPRIVSFKTRQKMKNQRIRLRVAVVTAIVLTLALSRLLPHPFNFSPVAALALFGGAHYRNRYAAYLIPLGAVWISDLMLNFSFYGHFVAFYSGSFFTYAAFALIVLLGSSLLKKLSPGHLMVSALSASVVFFLVSNFGVWAFSGMYSPDLTGLLNCYTAAIPFFRNTLAGDLIYTFAVFYGYALATRKLASFSIHEAQ